MDKKKVLAGIISAIALILAGLVIVTFFIKGPDEGEDGQPTETSSPGGPSYPIVETTPRSSPTMKVETPKGEISLNEVYRSKVPGTEYGNNFAFKKTDSYTLLYFPDQNDLFLMTIWNPDLEGTRKAAEAELLRILGANKEQACALHIDVTVPAQINPEAALIDFGLSFCPDGKPFPKAQ